MSLYAVFQLIQALIDFYKSIDTYRIWQSMYFRLLLISVVSSGTVFVTFNYAPIQCYVPRRLLAPVSGYRTQHFHCGSHDTNVHWSPGDGLVCHISYKNTLLGFNLSQALRTTLTH